MLLEAIGIHQFGNGKKPSRRPWSAICSVSGLLVSCFATASLVGCGTGSMNGGANPILASSPKIQGSVHGGQQPVSGATIQLYAALSTGYGVGSTPLISSTVRSGSDGSFSITGAYICPAASTPVFLEATGGSSGAAPNANLFLMAALGPCGNLSQSTFIEVNEITTVASVYSLAPFMSKYNAVSTSATNTTGLNNAFADVNLLANVGDGTTPGSVPSGVTVPVAEVKTLANIIAACVNSSGGTYNDGSPCGALFFNANPGGTLATAPTDTITAVMNIAQHPSSVNTSNLFKIAIPTSPFQTGLVTAPNDFSLAITMVGSGLNAPAALAADAFGNVFVANSGGNTVTEYSHDGTVLSGTGFVASFNTPSSIALNANGVVWVTNQGNSTVSRLDGNTGAAVSPVISGGGLDKPNSIAFDAIGNAWISNSGDASVTVIDSTASTLNNYTLPGAASPLAVAVSPH